MLACHIVTNFPDKSSPMDISKECPDSLCSAESSLPTVDLMRVDTASDSSDAGPPSIDLPLEAHVLPGRGRQFFAALPFLSIADDNNAVDMMTSLACQRYVWGISEPAVGFVLSETGVVTKLLLSWLDPTTVSRERSLDTVCSLLIFFSMSYILHVPTRNSAAFSILRIPRPPCVSRN
jgi:hypothetical protein